MFDLVWMLEPTAWLGLLTLVVLEIVLGIDNLLFIAILAEKLPPELRDRARRIGLALALVVIFQPELRVGLAKLGSHPFFSSFAKLQRVDFLDNFCKAVSKLSNQRFGALFAFERSISMKPIEDSGVKLDAIFSPELALTIFHTKTALHDGGVVISGDRISAAACVFPVSQKEMSDRTLGLRHRAGVGMSEESDCVVVVVSEETGAIALAVGGKLERNLTPEQLKGRLEELLNISSSNEKTAIA